MITIRDAAKIFADSFPEEAKNGGIISDSGEYYEAGYGIPGDFVANDFFVISKKDGSIKKEPFENMGKYDMPDELIGGPDYKRSVSELLKSH